MSAILSYSALRHKYLWHIRPTAPRLGPCIMQT